MEVVPLRENGGQVLVYQHIAHISYRINISGISSTSEKFYKCYVAFSY